MAAFARWKTLLALDYACENKLRVDIKLLKLITCHERMKNLLMSTVSINCFHPKLKHVCVHHENESTFVYIDKQNYRVTFVAGVALS